MQKTTTSEVIDSIIVEIEAELSRSKRHCIKTDTLKERALRHIYIDAGNEETQRLSDIGFGQVIQSRLYNAGYRSVRTGIFVNLDTCSDMQYLQALLESADISVKEKETIRESIRKIRDSHLDGQIYFTSEGDSLVTVIPINETEFMEKLEADAI